MQRERYAKRCIADPGPPQTGTVPGLQRIIALRFMLRSARDTGVAAESRLILRSARAVEGPQIRTRVRASRRMGRRYTPSCFETAASPPPQHEGHHGPRHETNSAVRSETRSRSRERKVVQSQGCGFFLFSSCSGLLSAVRRADQRSAGGAHFRF